MAYYKINANAQTIASMLTNKQKMKSIKHMKNKAKQFSQPTNQRRWFNKLESTDADMKCDSE
jgi:hypothetical protein